MAPATYPDIRRNEVRRRERRDKSPPIVEYNQQSTEDKSVVSSEELSLGPVRVLLVVTVEGRTIVKRVIVSCLFDLVIELRIRKTNHGVTDELRDDSIICDAPQNYRREGSETQERKETKAP